MADLNAAKELKRLSGGLHIPREIHLKLGGVIVGIVVGMFVGVGACAMLLAWLTILWGKG